LKKTSIIQTHLVNVFLHGIFLSIFFTTGSCGNNKEKESHADNKLIIRLQPFEGMPAAETMKVYSQLITIYPSVQLKNAIPFPAAAWYASRNRYRADSLINYLAGNTPAFQVTIGLTNKDISTSKPGYMDWGVMGLGFCPGHACIASTFRLSKKEEPAQLFKLCLHEWGHTMGLPHCSITTCYMRDAEGSNPFNEETGFCTDCKKKLVEKGWRL
jgi:archaemetzincin